MQPEEKILADFEEAPHIELNQDGSTIDLSNWHEPANRNWAYRHVHEFMPYTVRISRGDAPIHEFGSAPADLSALSINFRNRQMLLDEYLLESHADGVLVLKDNDIVYEIYRRMNEHDVHLCQSVSKTTACALTGILSGTGAIRTTDRVNEYFPAVASGFRGVELQNLLDMNTALDFEEDFTNPDADIHEYEMLGGWHPDQGAQRDGVLPYIQSLLSDPQMEIDGITHYLCPNTDMLAAIAEEQTSRKYYELFEQLVYRHIGAEADAYFCTDAQGLAVASGGLVIRLRDLARYAQTFANLGVANDGIQVIPEAWIADCLDTEKGTTYYLGEGFRYHNQMTTDGEALCHLGVGGQMLYANTRSKVVVVQFSTTSMLSSGDLDLGNALYDFARAVNEKLS